MTGKREPDQAPVETVGFLLPFDEEDPRCGICSVPLGRGAVLVVGLTASGYDMPAVGFCVAHKAAADPVREAMRAMSRNHRFGRAN
jgi:hypothetical protein